MRLNVVVIVWGEEYVRRFINWGLPSILAEHNLPELSRTIDCRLAILTHNRDSKMIRESPAYQRASSITQAEIFQLPPWDYTGAACDIQNYVQRFVWDKASRGEEAVLFCSPDVIWTDGSLSHVGRAFEAGKILIFLPNYRVTDETIRFDDELTNCFSKDRVVLTVPSLTGGQLLLKHAHPTLGACHYMSSHCPPHIDFYVWPVGHEGILLHHLVRGPEGCVPHRVKWTTQCLAAEENPTELVEAIQDSHVALGLSLTSVGQCANLIIENGVSASRRKFGQFMGRHPASLCGLTDPVVIRSTENFTPDLWQRETQEESFFFEQVLRWRRAVQRGEVPPEGVIYVPQSYSTQLSPRDCDLYVRLLSWAPSDCATIRLLERMSGDIW